MRNDPLRHGQPDEWAPFPVESLPVVLRNFAQEVARTMCVDEAFVVLPALGAAAGSIGNTYRIHVKEAWYEPSILWTVLVAESGTGKSPCIREVLAPLREREPVERAKYTKDQKVYEWLWPKLKETCEIWLKNNMKVPNLLVQQITPPKPPEFVRHRFMVGDTTTAALSRILQETPRGVLLHCDELTSWIGSFDKYRSSRGTDQAFWLSIHSAEPLLIDRKGEQIQIPRPAVSIVGGIQPGILRRVLRAEHWESGLLARILMAMPPTKPKKWNAAGVPEDVKSSMANALGKLLDLQPEARDPWVPRTISMSPAACKVFGRFYDEHNEDLSKKSDAVRSAYAKLEGCCARLALILHLFKRAAGESTEQADSIDAQTVEQAVTITKWQTRETQRIYATLAREPRNDAQLLAWINQQGGAVTVRDLQRRAPKAFRHCAEASLTTLVNDGFGRWCHTCSSTAGGRPTKTFTLLNGSDGDETPSGDSASRGNVAVASSTAGEMMPLVEDAESLDGLPSSVRGDSENHQRVGTAIVSPPINNSVEFTIVNPSEVCIVDPLEFTIVNPPESASSTFGKAIRQCLQLPISWLNKITKSRLQARSTE